MTGDQPKTLKKKNPPALQLMYTGYRRSGFFSGPVPR